MISISMYLPCHVFRRFKEIQKQWHQTPKYPIPPSPRDSTGLSLSKFVQISEFETALSWNVTDKCIVYCKIRRERDSALFFLLHALMEQMRTFVKNTRFCRNYVLTMKYKLCWPVNYFVTVPTKLWRPPSPIILQELHCMLFFITRMQCTMHDITWCNIMLCVQKWTMGGNCVKLWCSVLCLTEWIFTPWPWFYAPVCFNINERIDHWINTSWDRGLWLNGLLCHMIPSISALIPNMSAWKSSHMGWVVSGAQSLESHWWNSLSESASESVDVSQL